MSKRIIKNEGLNGFNRNLGKNKMKISYLHVENTKISSSFRLTSLKFSIYCYFIFAIHSSGLPVSVSWAIMQKHFRLSISTATWKRSEEAVTRRSRKAVAG